MLPVKIVSTGCYVPSVEVLSTELDHKFGVELKLREATCICSQKAIHG
jgi:hypothetical protein